MMTKTVIFYCTPFPKHIYPLPSRNFGIPPGGKEPVNSAKAGKKSGFQYLISDKALKVKFYKPWGELHYFSMTISDYDF